MRVPRRPSEGETFLRVGCLGERTSVWQSPGQPRGAVPLDSSLLSSTDVVKSKRDAKSRYPQIGPKWVPLQTWLPSEKQTEQSRYEFQKQKLAGQGVERPSLLACKNCQPRVNRLPVCCVLALRARACLYRDLGQDINDKIPNDEGILKHEIPRECSDFRRKVVDPHLAIFRHWAIFRCIGRHSSFP